MCPRKANSIIVLTEILRWKNCRSKTPAPEAGVAAVNNKDVGRPRRHWQAGLALLADERDFRVFYVGYSTSLLGTAMSRIALTFAVLGSGGGPADLGYIFAASVFPQVLIMLGGGVLADRIGRRRVMLVTDTGRFAVQAALATTLFEIGRAHV